MSQAAPASPWDNFHDSAGLEFTLTPSVNQPSYSWTKALSDDDGGVIPALLFKYHDPIKVIPGDHIPLYPGERPGR